MIGDKNNCLKAYKTVLFLNPRNEEIKKIVAEMEGTKEEKVPSSFLPDEHEEKNEYYIPPLPGFSPPEFEYMNIEEKEGLKFQEKPVNMAFKENPSPTSSEDQIPTELSTMTMGELLEAQGLKQKAAEVYRQLLNVEPNNTVLKIKLSNIEKDLGLEEFSEHEIIESETVEKAENIGSKPDEKTPPEDNLANIELIHKPIIEKQPPLEEESETAQAPHEDLDELLDDKWLLGEPISEDTKLKKLYTLLDGILKYKALHSGR